MAAPVRIYQVTGEELLPFAEKELPPHVLDEVLGNSVGPVLKAQRMWGFTRLFRVGGHEGPYMGCGYEMNWDKAARDKFLSLQDLLHATATRSRTLIQYVSQDTTVGVEMFEITRKEGQRISNRNNLNLELLCSWTGLKVVLVGLKATKNFAVFLVAPPLGRKLGRLVVRQATKHEGRYLPEAVGSIRYQHQGIEVPVASLQYPTLHLDDSIYETNSGLPFVRDQVRLVSRACLPADTTWLATAARSSPTGPVAQPSAPSSAGAGARGAGNSQQTMVGSSSAAGGGSRGIGGGGRLFSLTSGGASSSSVAADPAAAKESRAPSPALPLSAPRVHVDTLPEEARRALADQAERQAWQRWYHAGVGKMRREGLPEPTIFPMYLLDGDWRAVAERMIHSRARAMSSWPPPRTLKGEELRAHEESLRRQPISDHLAVMDRAVKFYFRDMEGERTHLMIEVDKAVVRKAEEARAASRGSAGARSPPAPLTAGPSSSQAGPSTSPSLEKGPSKRPRDQDDMDVVDAQQEEGQGGGGGEGPGPLPFCQKQRLDGLNIISDDEDEEAEQGAAGEQPTADPLLSALDMAALRIATSADVQPVLRKVGATLFGQAKDRFHGEKKTSENPGSFYPSPPETDVQLYPIFTPDGEVDFSSRGSNATQGESSQAGKGKAKPTSGGNGSDAEEEGTGDKSPCRPTKLGKGAEKRDEEEDDASTASGSSASSTSSSSHSGSQGEEHRKKASKPAPPSTKKGSRQSSSSSSSTATDTSGADSSSTEGGSVQRTADDFEFLPYGSEKLLDKCAGHVGYETPLEALLLKVDKSSEAETFLGLAVSEKARECVESREDQQGTAWQLLFVCPKDCLPHEDPVKGFGLVTLEEAGDNHTFPLPAHNKKYGVIQGYTLDESVRGMSLAEPLAAALLDSSVTNTAAGVLAVFSNENPHSAHVVSKAAGRSGLPHAAFFHDSGGISLYGYREERIKGATPLALPGKGQYQPSFCFKDFDFEWADVKRSRHDPSPKYTALQDFPDYTDVGNKSMSGKSELWMLKEEPTQEVLQGYKLFMFSYKSEPMAAVPGRLIKRVQWFGCGVVGDYLKAVPGSGSKVREQLPVRYDWRDQFNPGNAVIIKALKPASTAEHDELAEFDDEE